MWAEWENEEFPPVVSVAWLKDYIKKNEENLGDPKVRILDGSWHPPTTKRSGLGEWKTQHIAGALFFDITKCVDSSDPKLVFMPPTEAQFEEYVGNLGINNDTHVVVYDNNEMFGMLAAPRVWWLFRLFGHNRVSILDGGFPAWKSGTQLPVDLATAVVPKVERQTFKATYRPELVKSFEDLVGNCKADGKQFQLVDARPAGRFEGTAPEPNHELKSGHVLGARNMFINECIIDPQTKRMREKSAILAAFDRAGIKLDQPITAMCGTGIGACHVVFGCHLLHIDNVPIYEGSWGEWDRRADEKMKAMGPA